LKSIPKWIFNYWKTWLQNLDKLSNLKKFILSPPGSFLRLWWGFIYLMLLFTFWRFVFFLYQIPVLEGSNWLVYLKSFYIGLRLDAVVAAYLILPIFLSIFWNLPPRGQSIYSKISIWYFSLLTIIISYLSAIDIFFFEEFNTHLNLLLLQANVVREESILYLWQEYPIIIITLGISLIGWLGYKTFTKTSLRLMRPDTRWPNTLAAGVLSLIILVSAIRGGWQERPIDWGHAMFSDNLLANQIALNGVFLLGRSAIELSSEKNLRESLQFFSQDMAFEQTRAMIAGFNDFFVDEYSLKRKIKEKPSITPNIVTVILESHVASFCGYINPAEKRVTPILDSLASQGIAFTRCIANGSRSAFGISSILMSWPVLPGLPLISQVESSREAPCMATNLKQLGYNSTFLYGGDSQFDNMQGFAIANGYDAVIDRKNLSSLPGTMWGIYDHYIFDYALELLDNTDDPLNLTLFTTTNHQPWELPDVYEASIPDFSDVTFRKGNVHRTMAYVDLVIGEFMQKAQSRVWFDNTIFVFVADHGLTIYRDKFEDLRNGHIPLVIYAPAILETPRLIDKPVSQVDIMPTLLGIIGYPKEFVAMGRDVLANDGAFASRITNDYFIFMENDLLYTEFLGQKSKLYRIDDFLSMSQLEISQADDRFKIYQERSRSYLQTAFLQFKSFGK